MASPKANSPDFVGEGLKPSPTAIGAPATVGAAGTSPFPRRKPTRLPGYDYATPGAYFITTCTDGYRCLFGRVEDGIWQANRLGGIVEECWLQLRTHYPAIDLDEFSVMPNHFHGVVHLRDGAPSLIELVRGFKTFSARRINAMRHSPRTRVWQRSFYDRIVRSDADLQRIRAYIFDNPGNWDKGRSGGSPNSVGEGFKPSPTAAGARTAVGVPMAVGRD